MSVRRKLFGIWCGFTVLWWLFGIFVGDGSLILRKFQMGGWPGAYVHLSLTVLIAVGVPALVFLVGRVVLWGADRFQNKRSYVA